MPMVANALKSMLTAKLKTLPIGKSPASTTIASTPNADGTVSVSSIPGPPQPVFMDAGLIDAISSAVSECVVLFLTTNAVATGANTGGPVVSKIT